MVFRREVPGDAFLAFSRLENDPMTESDQQWLRCQSTIRQLLHSLGKDALVYAQSALENEASEPERLKFFWENARKCFDNYQAPA